MFRIRVKHDGGICFQFDFDVSGLSHRWGFHERPDIPDEERLKEVGAQNLPCVDYSLFRSFDHRLGVKWKRRPAVPARLHFFGTDLDIRPSGSALATSRHGRRLGCRFIRNKWSRSAGAFGVRVAAFRSAQQWPRSRVGRFVLACLVC